MSYIKFNDPSHGWLRVKTKELYDLGIADKITGYSYISDDGKYTYLEEDQDMTTFMQVKGKVEYTIKTTDNPSSIRRKNPYSPPLPFGV